MTVTSSSRPHTFHIPVMGIGFTIDTAIRLAPLGIDSAISLVNDDVIEAARAHQCRMRLLPYRAIAKNDPDSRAERITAYLNLVDDLVANDRESLRNSSFDEGGRITRYFELLPEGSALRARFHSAILLPQGTQRAQELEELREFVVAGAIGVNIMTKVDGPLDERGEPRPAHGSDAHSALRGFAHSKVSGPLILSAGANPGLFAYLGEFDDFFPDKNGHTKKTLILKVSDFRSAHVQGRMLARRGIWVSEYRVESGVNCGGHAFPADGNLLGPVLSEFRERRHELALELFPAYQKGLLARGLPAPDEPPPVRITAQGGIGTASEDRVLREAFALDGTGWGSPFLLVPEAVALDDQTKGALLEAKDDDIFLSHSSPLGVRFWWLKTCASEDARKERIRQGNPGSVCTARHLALNTEFGKVPLCPGSRAYQKRKKATLDPNSPSYALEVERLEAPACICVDLCGSYLACVDDSPPPPPAICPGPNVVNFQNVYTLEQMVGHIYGRDSILTRSDRPHMFVRELELYLNVLEEDLQVLGTKVESLTSKQIAKSLAGLTSGIHFYQANLAIVPAAERESFSSGLAVQSERLKAQVLRLEAHEQREEALKLRAHA